jgi:hypothetical protein
VPAREPPARASGPRPDDRVSAVTGGIRHPFTRALYEPDGSGGVRVTKDGTVGRFQRDGRWIEGELREADPELCLWLTAARPPRHHRLSAVEDSHGPAG